jgi:hypothetical protein
MNALIVDLQKKAKMDISTFFDTIGVLEQMTNNEHMSKHAYRIIVIYDDSKHHVSKK